MLEGAREVLTAFRPVVLFEVFDAALQKQGSSRDKLLELFRSLSYELFIFDDRSGQPAPAPFGGFSDNMIAIPAESPAVQQFPSSPAPLVYADHIEGNGTRLFQLTCEEDLEGIVAKRKDGLYTPDETTWVKVKNPAYSQAEGRRELFEKTVSAVSA